MQQADITIHPIPAFTDNYFWCLHREGERVAAIVDPGAAGPVVDYLSARKLALTAILITHHHPDHIGGIAELLKRYPAAQVFGPAGENIPGIHRRLHGGDNVSVDPLDLDFTVLDVPGHTLGHIAFYDVHRSLLFCGDTLFSVGCGRLREGSAAQLYESLLLLSRLPPDTKVYCTHEYTLSNIDFAKQVEPDNVALQQREAEVQRLRAENLPSLPSTIGLELASNPFLRTDQDTVMEAVEKYWNRPMGSPGETFAALRKWKDEFV
jgi:hydroxyacylglutathione hydrolase